MEMPKLSSYLTIAALGIGLFLNITFGIWNLSELFYRVSALEAKQLTVGAQEEVNRTALEETLVKEATIASKIDGVRDTLDKMLERDYANPAAKK